MRTVLVTGPIGGGKSTACRYLASLGHPVFDCDSRCKALYDEVPGLKDRVERELGIPFSHLKKIFADDALRERLENIVYPLLVSRIEDWKRSAAGSLAFIESAIALQKPAFDGLYDGVLLVTAPRELRLERDPRACERDRLQSFDSPRIDYTITNDSTPESLQSKIDKYLNTL